MFRDYNLRKYDILIILIVIALVGFGIVNIASATQVNSSGSQVKLNKQLYGFIVMLVLTIGISFIDYHFIGKFYWLIYAFNIILLLAVRFIGFNVKGAVRWIDLGIMSIQPSELAKIMLIVFLAKLIDKNRHKINSIFFLMQIAVLVLIPTLLIYIQPDLSTSLVIVVISVIMIYVAGISYKYVIGALMIAVPLMFVTIWYSQQPDQKLFKPHQVTRVKSFLYPESEGANVWQTENSIQALGSGQLRGKGWYGGTINKYNYLPEPQTDFIFSIIGEEFGFIGCSITLLMLLVLILRCLWVAKDAIDLYGMLIIVGFVAMITFQTFVNVGVATGIIPNTGIPLPFISYGLSSLISNMIGIGLVLNVSIHRKTSYY